MLDPSRIEKEQTYENNFDLDETVGDEVYYAIAALEEFRFDEEIRPHLKKMSSGENSKGPVFSEYQIELPEKFTQEQIYFTHRSRSSEKAEPGNPH
jgi:hypothetical protein